jgi:4-amino-4-deoxy-L-arabinose transferase-like glycosyltransferase
MSSAPIALLPEPSWTSWLNKWFPWLTLIGILVNASGLLLPVLEPDGALYATISKHMALTGDYINLKVEGYDWLDKPHMPFWITAFSFKLFGVNAFAYKFPALLCWLAGAYYTYALANKLYNTPTAQLSVLLYLAAEHLIISNNDVRAEPYLTGFMIAAAYYYYRGYTGNKLIHFVAGSFALALGVMTKGIFIACMVWAGFVIDIVLNKKWNAFFNYRWWLSVLLTLVFIMPELCSLYWQFDRHPEKTVFGKTQVSGVRFFFWDSQFGRFFNSGPIRGKGDKLFYVHTLLWAFLPWSLILYTQVIAGLVSIRSVFVRGKQYICEGIAGAGFLVFSLSAFQLPHYLNILFPFMAIITGRYIITLSNGIQQRLVLYGQYTLYVLLFVAGMAGCIFFGGPYRIPVLMVLLLAAIITWRMLPQPSLRHMVGRSFMAIMAVNLFLNAVFYPQLFQYQSGLHAARFVNQQAAGGPVYLFNGLSSEYAFQFYSNAPVQKIDTRDLDTITHAVRVYTPAFQLDSLQQLGYRVERLQSFPHFHISQLTGKFLNPATRKNVVDTFVVARIER